MGRKRGREASLKVFSGREASLNLIIFLILYPKGNFWQATTYSKRLGLPKDTDTKENKMSIDE